MDNFVHALAVDQAGNLYAGGDFTTAGEAPARRIARWDGAQWSPLGSGIGAEGDYSSIATLVVDERGNLYVGGQFTLAGSKPSAYLAKWCAELAAGGCTFTFEASASTPEPAPVLSAPAPVLSKTPTTSATEPGPFPTVAPTVEPVAEAGMDSRLWIGAGAVLTVLLGSLLLFRSRRS